jgi:hypothetical protein
VRVEGLALAIGAAIQQAQRRGMIVQRADVADKRCRVHDVGVALAEEVVAVSMAHLGAGLAIIKPTQKTQINHLKMFLFFFIFYFL